MKQIRQEIIFNKLPKGAKTVTTALTLRTVYGYRGPFPIPQSK